MIWKYFVNKNYNQITVKLNPRKEITMRTFCFSNLCLIIGHFIDLQFQLLWSFEVIVDGISQKVYNKELKNASFEFYRGSCYPIPILNLSLFSFRTSSPACKQNL
jgi:hypothetical protein